MYEIIYICQTILNNIYYYYISQKIYGDKCVGMRNVYILLLH